VKRIMEGQVHLIQLFEQREIEIIGMATNALDRAHLTHYDEAGVEQNKTRLQALFDVMLQCIKDRNPAAMIDYAEDLAQERFASGFDLCEVQMAFNVLEEAIWQQIINECSPSQLAEALGLVSTMHGVGKDALARKYVSLASQTKVPSLNLQALMKSMDDL